MFKQTKNKKSGFTIVELAAVVVVLAFLSAAAIVSYTALQQKAHDTAVLSDIDAIEGIVTNYSLKNDLEHAYYYSGTPADVAELGFTPSDGNVIDVVTNHTDYCIRGYNSAGTKNSIYSAFTRESNSGSCVLLPPSESATIVFSGDNVWTQVSSSYLHTCAIDGYGKVYCWGLNDSGQLGNGITGTNSNTPVAVDMTGALAGKRAKYVVTGYWHTCVLASDNLPYCWGADWGGQLGDGGSTNSNVPVAVKTSGNLLNKTIKKIVSSWGRVCVLASDDYEYCWGDGDHGALGWSGWSAGSYSEPVPVYMNGVLSGKTVSDITEPGNYHSCLIASDNKPYCWGWNDNGQLGNNSTATSTTPVAVDMTGVLKNKRVKSITVNDNSTCAIASDNRPYCWGDNSYGSLGDNTIIDKHIPNAVNVSGVLSGKNLVKFSPSFDFSVCAYSSDLKYYCWGLDNYYQLGDNDTSNKLSPVVGSSINNIDTMDLSVGWNGDCAITKSYALYCWGDGTSGRIGAGDNSSSSTPVLVNPVP